MPTLGEVQQQAARENPEIRSALATVQETGHDVTGARSGYLPSLSLDYFMALMRRVLPRRPTAYQTLVPPP